MMRKISSTIDGTKRWIEATKVFRGHHADSVLNNRQGLGRHSCPLAREVGRVPPRSPQERRVQRRCQGSFTGGPLYQNHCRPASTRKSLILRIVRPALAHICTLQKTRRRTYRAHGRINPYQGHPVHIEVIVVAAEEEVERNKEKDALSLKGLNRRQVARKRIEACRTTTTA